MIVRGAIISSGAPAYRDILAPGSCWAVHHFLVTIAALLGGEGTDLLGYPWRELEYRGAARVRREPGLPREPMLAWISVPAAVSKNAPFRSTLWRSISMDCGPKNEETSRF